MTAVRSETGAGAKAGAGLGPLEGRPTGRGENPGREEAIGLPPLTETKNDST